MWKRVGIVVVCIFAVIGVFVVFSVLSKGISSVQAEVRTETKSRQTNSGYVDQYVDVQERELKLEKLEQELVTVREQARVLEIGIVSVSQVLSNRRPGDVINVDGQAYPYALLKADLERNEADLDLEKGRLQLLEEKRKELETNLRDEKAAFQKERLDRRLEEYRQELDRRYGH